MGTRTRFGRGGKFAVALSVASALVLSACSDDGDSADDSAGKNLDGRGAISFAMGKNDLDLIRPVVASWNKAHADEQVKLVEPALQRNVLRLYIGLKRRENQPGACNHQSRAKPGTANST